MNCFECAKVNDTVPAVATCQRCSVGLCLDHLIEARNLRVGGTLFGCGHEMPRTKPLRGMPVGVAESARHHSAVS